MYSAHVCVFRLYINTVLQIITAGHPTDDGARDLRGIRKPDHVLGGRETSVFQKVSQVVPANPEHAFAAHSQSHEQCGNRFKITGGQCNGKKVSHHGW